MNRILIAAYLNPSLIIPHGVSLMCGVLIIASAHYHLSRVLRGRWLSHDNWALSIDNIRMLVVEGIFPNGQVIGGTVRLRGGNLVRWHGHILVVDSSNIVDHIEGQLLRTERVVATCESSLLHQIILLHLMITHLF